MSFKSPATGINGEILERSSIFAPLFASGFYKGMIFGLRISQK